ncbi:unnamed protein product [Adineta steineri]|uniref:Uncharacterized protein n=1 Tax=Adineta steineri TaxID=433720 RepID=A0A818RD47_9BILA|nr:unnamed protein product [Adineta steineri]CAF1394336.1 unnamed protein product [Adineta steineri]CAF3652379.1 unnamed protein product [Adineta steineri]CAF3875037.1 unnamed protein product [Adineta steineri]
MDRLLFTILSIFLIYFVGNVDGIRCYNCLQGCSDPFNKTNTNANSITSSSGWCMKLKTSRKHDFVFTRTSAPFGVSIINSDRCACCFPNQSHNCQTPAIDLPCNECTSDFCAQHVKGCQGFPACKAECMSSSSSTTTMPSPSSTMTTSSSSSTTTVPIKSTTFNGGSMNQYGLFIISIHLTLLTLINFFYIEI